jgi:superfamily II DNA or RNA helicase
MLMGAIEKLDVLRAQMPQAGGLVIAPSIPVAEYMCELLEELDGEKPVIVHSQMNNAEDKIVAFRNSNRRWLVSVAMVSEGVDIPRLRVLVYLPNPLTELAFRQAIGRVVRSFGPDDFSSAQVVLPALSIFDTYARRIEKEMPDHVKKAIRETSEKICPSCNASVPFNSKVCECGHIFTTTISKTKACHECGTLNPYSASECFHCGAGFLNEFSITLEEALRVGAIVRGMDLEEWEVQESEEMAPSMRTALLSSGDENLIRILRTFPEQSLTRLKSILNSA